MKKKKRHTSNRRTPVNSFSPSFRTKVFFILGITGILFFISWKIHNMTILSFSYDPSAQIKTTATDFPVNISIPGAHINLPVSKTTIVNGIWQIADNGASYLVTSAQPGHNGTIIIYGHNTLDRFANIPYMYRGEAIIVTTKDGKTHHYELRQTTVVSPDQTEILSSQQGETLIIYTCYGFADLQRFVVIAKPKTS